MNLQKLRAIREGQRRIVSRQLEKFNEELTELDKSELLDVIASKADIIKGLNEKIINNAEIEDIETELVESEEYSIELGLKLRRLRENIRNSNIQTTNQSQREYKHQQRGSCSENGDSTIQPTGNTNINNQNVSNNLHSFPAHTHKLPKLRLPEFDGDITMWQTFWDSYDSAVHSNPSLSDVQKFNYLQSLVHGTAAAAISGFPLTHVNYGNAVELLKERFGKPDLIRSTLMQSLLDLPKPNDNAQSLRSFHDKMETLVRGLESLGQSEASYGDLLIPIILKKLPEQMKQNMAREQRSVHWEFQDLRSAISREITILEAGTFNVSSREADVHIPTASFFTGTKPKVSEQKNERTRNYNQRNDYKKVCPFCNGEHFPNECKKVTSYESRMSIIKRDKLCFNCLKKHQVSSCRSTNRCHHCKRKHHTSICEKYTKQQIPSTLNLEAASFIIPATPNEPCSCPEKSETAALHSTSQPTHDVLLKTAVADVCSDSATVEANILFDEGAQRSFITEELARKLDIKQTDSEIVNLASFGDTNQRVRRMDKCNVDLIAYDGEKLRLEVLVVPKIAVPIRNAGRNVTELPYIRGLKLAHPVTDDKYFEISLLIGADSYWKIVQDQIIRGNGPTAVQSRIGYLLSGPLPASPLPVQGCLQLAVNTIPDPNTHLSQTPTPTHLLNVLTSRPDQFDIEKFWKLESLGISDDEEKIHESTYLEKYQCDSITYNNGRYTAKLPWKEDHAPLPTNYEITRKRTENVIKRLRNDDKILKTYGEIIDNQERKGFIERVDESVIPDHRIHYIPHHCVKKDSVTTPIRIVYDCSCHQSRKHPSLNDCLKSTPPELNDLTHILIRFRLNKYAVTTYIEKAFLQIQLADEDRDVTRFLWLSDPEDPDSTLITYRFKAVLFGATCSPFILNATLLKHLTSNNDLWVSDIIRRDLYVDNVLSSFEDEDQTISYFRESRNLLSSANFNLRSWNSNSQKLRDLALINGIQDTDKTTKILGMRWDAESDILKFPNTCIPQTNITTKREILRQTSRIFDPLGLFSPVTVRAKIMLQQIWTGNFDWDTILPAEIQEKWESLAKDLNSISETKFNRCYFKSPKEVEKSKHEKQLPTALHVFVDASQSSYGAAAYLCKGQQSSLIMAKNRVAPLKALTLPRLELMAATIGAKLLNHLQKTLDVTEFYMWSDSQIVLHWLQTTKPLQRFIHNRVEEIKRLTGNKAWKYCPTNYNPADLLTRGISAKQFEDNTLWQNGPSWINSPSEWPTWKPNGDIVLTYLLNPSDHQPYTSPSFPSPTMPNPSPNAHGIHRIMTIERYSSYQKLLRVTAFIQRFVRTCRKATRPRDPSPHDSLPHDPLSPDELQRAEKIWLRDCQTHS